MLSEKELYSFLDSLSSFIVLVSKNGRILYINNYACSSLGYQREELLGSSFVGQFFAPPFRSTADRHFHLHLQLAPSDVLTWSTEMLAKDESILYLQFLITVQHCLLQEPVLLYSGENETGERLTKLVFSELHQRSRSEKVKAIVEAVEKERQHLAYELHDGVNQVLTTCKLLVEVEESQRASHTLGRVRNYIQQAIDSIRGLSHNLNPGEAGIEGLYDSIKSLIADLQATNRLQIKFKAQHVKELRKIPPAHSLSLYRILQEVLTNIIKHAEASEVTIKLIGSPQSIDLEVTDNGRGFRNDSITKGLGFKSIHLRAEAMGGVAFVQSNTGKGTLVSVHIPYDSVK